MGKIIKTGAFTMLLVAGISCAAFAQATDLSQVQGSLADFSDEAARSLPFHASMGLNWSDAYIGKIFPSLPPHFGAGLAAGFTTMDAPAIKTLAGHLGYTLPGNGERLYYPSYTAEARIGGFFAPMDLGVKFGYLPSWGLPGGKTDVSSLLAGGDIRFAILDGKANMLLPNVSLGAGVNYLKGGVRGESGLTQTFNLGDDALALKNPTVNLTWESLSLDVKAQISKSFLILTPYLGAGASYAWTTTGYSTDADVTLNGAPLSQVLITGIQGLLNIAGLGDINVTQSGISSELDKNAFSFRLFGGISVNLLVVRLDVTGLYSIPNGDYGATVGLRFQL